MNLYMMLLLVTCIFLVVTLFVLVCLVVVGTAKQFTPCFGGSTDFSCVEKWF